MLQTLFSSIGFAIGVTLPSVLLLMLGFFLRRTSQINANFIAHASRLVFNFGMPMLLFSKLVQSDIHYGEQVILLAAGISATSLTFILSEIYAWKFVPRIADKGVFVQGVFRSNLGGMGIALVWNAYGEAGVPQSAVYMGVMTIFYNVLSVITLSRNSSGGLKDKIKNILNKVLTNPLVIAIVVALSLQFLSIKPPQPILQTTEYLGAITLPLALICAGAAFDTKSLFSGKDVAFQASLGRLIVSPLITVLVALAFGLQGISMGVIFLMTATPVAAANYVMTKAMGGNDVAAANIMGMTTLGSMFSAAIGIVILRGLGLM